ncbi:MAG TPA: circularly permuted type 2 ATP-grasp protein, partial [Candidatus Binataceae bacterium]|nr:circularly permuted type 2 ATP-grasp protein [Candidatus Binataceae bacterium]
MPSPQSAPLTGWSYQSNPGFYDEMIATGGTLRPHWAELMGAIEAMGAEGLATRWREGRKLLYDNGVTYNVYGDPRSTDRPWPLDPIPFGIDEKEWLRIEDAMRQRATLLNAVLADIYGPQRLLHQNLFPPEIVFRHPGFLRPCCNVAVPGNIYLHHYSADLARSPDGRWWVIADRTQAPSGAGYALENRLVSQRVLPDVFRASQVRRLADFFIAYRENLRSLVPHNRDNPRIVLLTPGPYNESYFEHAFLA